MDNLSFLRYDVVFNLAILRVDAMMAMGDGRGRSPWGRVKIVPGALVIWTEKRKGTPEKGIGKRGNVM